LDAFVNAGFGCKRGNENIMLNVMAWMQGLDAGFGCRVFGCRVWMRGGGRIAIWEIKNVVLNVMRACRVWM
jgi:hypothetical protein